jgi:hypothetical protein
VPKFIATRDFAATLYGVPVEAVKGDGVESEDYRVTSYLLKLGYIEPAPKRAAKKEE